MVEGPRPATRLSIDVDATLEQPFHAVVIVPVVFAQQHHREVVIGEPAGVDQQLHRAVVERLRRVVDSLLVVGIRTALEQQPRQVRVMGHAGSAVQRALPRGRRLVVGVEEARRGARARVEECRRGVNEGRRSRGLEPQVLGEAKAGERIPSTRPALCDGARRIRGDEPPHGRVVTEDCGDVDAGARHVGMGGQDRCRRVERPVPDALVDEMGQRIHQNKRPVLSGSSRRRDSSRRACRPRSYRRPAGVRVPTTPSTARCRCCS